MFEVLISVLVISSIGAALALVLVISERFIVNYGECQIDINSKRQLIVQGGNPLLSALTDEKVFIPSACGGRGTCGFCKVKVLEGAGGVEGVLPTEKPFLSEEEIESHFRLSCQVKIRDDISIEVPEDLFNVKEYDCVCVDIQDLTYDTKRFRFELKEPNFIDFVAGQYVQLLCPRYKGNPEEVYRAYSIASDPKAHSVIDLIIRRVPNGICTTYCFDHLKVNDNVKLNGPYGNFKLSDTDSPMIFIAGGSGMAPFVSILHQMKNFASTRRAVYFLGGNEVRDIYLEEEMRQFEADIPGFRFVPVVARPDNNSWNGETGLVTEAVSRNFENIAENEGYLCGSPGMIDASIKVLNDLGIPEDKIYYDKFG